MSPLERLIVKLLGFREIDGIVTFRRQYTDERDRKYTLYQFEGDTSSDDGKPKIYRGYYEALLDFPDVGDRVNFRIQDRETVFMSFLKFSPLIPLYYLIDSHLNFDMDPEFLRGNFPERFPPEGNRLIRLYNTMVPFDFISQCEVLNPADLNN